MKYFTFPQNPTLRKMWAERTSRPNLFDECVNPGICERHFVKEDYLPDKPSRNIPGRVVTKRLNKKCAIPSRNLGRKFAPILITAVKEQPINKQGVLYEKIQEPTVLNFSRYR